MSSANTVDPSDLYPQGWTLQSIVLLSKSVLAEMLGFPPGTRIVAVSEPFDRAEDVRVKVEDERLRTVGANCVVPQLTCRFSQGAVSVRQEWHGTERLSGYLKPIPPIIRPHADKIAAMLVRVSEELCRTSSAGSAAHEEVLRAIDELKGVEAPASEPLSAASIENTVEVKVSMDLDAAALAETIHEQWKKLARMQQIHGLSGRADGCRFHDGILTVLSEAAGASDVAALAETAPLSARGGCPVPPAFVDAIFAEAEAAGAYCPQHHHLKDGPCMADYCRCPCPFCRDQCEERRRS